MSSKKSHLLIMRHAKSDHPLDGTKDFDRVLNHRGQQQPSSIAEQLKKKGFDIDLALVSPSQRTTQTFKLLAKELDDLPTPIFDQRLYNAHIDDVLDVLNENAHSNNILLIGHNPSVSLLCSLLTNDYHELGTAYLAVLRPKKSNIFESLKAGGFEVEEILLP